MEINVSGGGVDSAVGYPLSALCCTPPQPLLEYLNQPKVIVTDDNYHKPIFL
jgi:hypothetical protein